MALLKSVSVQKPRQIAAQVLRQRRAEGPYVEDLLQAALAGAALSPADRGLCQELTYGAVRWQATLDWLIGQKTDGREQKPALQNLLRLGLYQIFWLSRIPPHAAVHETVELAKQSGLGPQAGFVNALLRSYVREQDKTRQLLAELKTKQPALGWSHPEWLVARWQKRWGLKKTAQLLEWNNTPPKTFARVNTLKLLGSARCADRTPQHSVPTLLALWAGEGVEHDFVRRDWLGENLVFELKSHPPLDSLASFRGGGFYIQDPSTLLAPVLLGAQPGEAILDFCAAPGGKTTFIAQLMNNQGRIVAQDVSEARLGLIRENCARLGVTCAETALPSTLNAQPSTTFDRVLVDAPCSNTGVMRRRVDLRWRIQPKELGRLQSAQLELLEQAAGRVRSGGVLVYSTCSLEPEENQDVVKQFLTGHSAFRLDHEPELLPFTDRVDGAYIARLHRLP
ncbi:MAG TPA: 16S rRNA (cytosine(967)-C(5))-methyltransferase RsmB [Candidatus Acidoferrum sp.]|nr:16S rRNA (cytosine(967)-C(5))-methyltransferase RsmB [Candidatus Acidoferrum sp.]